MNPQTEVNNVQSLHSDEESLKLVARILLLGGIISALILFFNLAIITIPSEYTQFGGKSKTIFNWPGFVISLCTLLSSIGLYYFMVVIGNISISLKEMNKKS